jgi:hypothetical protein
MGDFSGDEIRRRGGTGDRRGGAFVPQKTRNRVVGRGLRRQASERIILPRGVQIVRIGSLLTTPKRAS